MSEIEIRIIAIRFRILWRGNTTLTELEAYQEVYEYLAAQALIQDVYIETKSQDLKRHQLIAIEEVVHVTFHALCNS